MKAVRIDFSRLQPDGYDDWNEDQKLGFVTALVTVYANMDDRGLSHLIPLIFGSDDEYAEMEDITEEFEDE